MPTYTIRDVPVEFPYDAYDCQVQYMEKCIEALEKGTNALLESPTGTGKTLCLLCATLAWRSSGRHKAVAKQEQAAAGGAQLSWADQLKAAYAEAQAAGEVRVPPIIYSSRTHSQLAQVMRELRRTSYRPRVCILGSRQQQCVHPAVSKLPGDAANQACRALTAKRGCPWHNRVEGFMKRNPDANAEPMDMEDLAKLGNSSSGPCPYFLSRDMAANADIVFMPYNYLVDPQTRMGMKNVQWRSAILIFDEAHNVEGVCSEAASFNLPAPVLTGCINEVEKAYQTAMLRLESQSAQAGAAMTGDGKAVNYSQLSMDLRRLRGVLMELEKAIAQVQCGPNGATFPGAYLFAGLFARMGLNAENVFTMLALLDDAQTLLSDVALEVGRRSTAAVSSFKLGLLANALKLAFNTNSLEDSASAVAVPDTSAYRVHIHLERPKGKGRGPPTPTLSYWCFQPGLAMRALQAMGVRSILLTSGTLSPLGGFAQELLLPFPVQLENPHVIDPKQVWVGVLPVGPGGVALNSTFQKRDTPQYKSDLGHAVASLAGTCPDGLLVFFPSYGVLQSCVDHWKATSGSGGASIYDRILRHKAAVVEPREAALFPEAAAMYKSKLATGGAVFFAVCRGKVSEGLDFADAAGRAVVITGIPYAPRHDAKVTLKQQVLDEAAAKARKAGGGQAGGMLSGQMWYTQQAMRALNQAMGRVIRHRHDYGAIILADERFLSEGTRKQISCWLRDSVVAHENFGAATKSLQAFFKAQSGRQPDTLTVAAQAASRSVFGSTVQAAGVGGKPRNRLLVPTAMDTTGLGSMVAAFGQAAGSAGGASRQAGGSALMKELEKPVGSNSAAVGGKPPMKRSTDATAATANGSGLDSMLAGLIGNGAPAESDNPRSFKARPAKRAKRRPAAEVPDSKQLPQAPAADPLLVGPAHLLARHRARLAAGGSANPSSSGDPGSTALGGGQNDSASSPAGAVQSGGAAGSVGGGRSAPVLAAAAASSTLRPEAQPGAHGCPAPLTTAGPAATGPPLAHPAASLSRTVQQWQGIDAAGLPPARQPPVRHPAGYSPASAQPQHTLPPPTPYTGAASAAPAAAPASGTSGHQCGSSRGGSGSASAGAAAAGAQQTLLDYHARLKSDLGAVQYAAVVKAVRVYKKSTAEDRKQVLLDTVLAVLSAPGQRHLLPSFTVFLPAADRPAYLQRIRGVLGKDAAAIGDPSTGKLRRPGSGQDPSALQPATQAPAAKSRLPRHEQAGAAPHSPAGSSRAGNSAGDAGLRRQLPPRQFQGQRPAQVPVGHQQAPAHQHAQQPNASGSNGSSGCAGSSGGGRQAAAAQPSGRPVLAAASANVPAAPPPLVIQRPCPVCKAPSMAAPWVAPCKHVACNLCWVTAIAKSMACPVCSVRTQKRNLTRVLTAAALP